MSVIVTEIRCFKYIQISLIYLLLFFLQQKKIETVKSLQSKQLYLDNVALQK